MSETTFTLVKRIVLHPTLHFMRFTCADRASFSFIAGQHAVFLAKDEQGQIQEKPMSIASSPSQSDIEFLVTIREGSAGSKFFQSIEVGSSVPVTGPRGSYGLAPAVRPLFFVSSHSGLSPLRSMIHEILETKGCKYPVTLFFSAPMEQPNMLTEAFEGLRVRHPNFSFQAFKTEENENGFARMQPALESLPSDGIDVYYCGGKDFMAAKGAFVQRKGLPSDCIHIETY